MNVYILLSGDGGDGDEQTVEGVYSTEAKAEFAAAILKLSDYRKTIQHWVLDKDE